MSVNSKADKNIKILYALYAVGALFGAFTIAAVIMAYVQDDDQLSVIQIAHKQWLKRTFWISAAGMVVGAILAIIFVGYFIIFAAWVWYVYRVIKGWVRYSDDRLPKGEREAIPASEAHDNKAEAEAN